MPNTREKLIELLEQSLNHDRTGREMRFVGGDVTPVISSGVTIQDDHHWATEQAYKNGYADGQPKWISVKERLPEDSCRVLIRSASGYIGTELYNKGRGQFECCGVWIPVTHWMPLPEAPKGE